MDAAAGGAIYENASGMDALLLGRRTYDIFAGYWPSAPADSPFTELLNRVPKYVGSSTLSEPLGWSNSTVLDGDLADAVRGLKERHRELHVIGSLDLTADAPAPPPDRPARAVDPPHHARHRRAPLRRRHRPDELPPARVGRLRQRHRPPLARAHRHADLRDDRRVSGRRPQRRRPCAGIPAWATTDHGQKSSNRSVSPLAGLRPPMQITSRPSGPASNERITAGATRSTSQVVQLDDLVVELRPPGAAHDDVRLLLLAMPVTPWHPRPGLVGEAADAELG